MIKDKDGNLLDIGSTELTETQKAFYDGYGDGWLTAHKLNKPKLESIKACARANGWHKSEIAKPYYDMICELINEAKNEKNNPLV